MTQEKFASNPYGKTGDVATRQIIDRILTQHFKPGSSTNRPVDKGRSIGEMQDEILREMAKKSQVVDFGKGENCEFPGTRREMTN